MLCRSVLHPRLFTHAQRLSDHFGLGGGRAFKGEREKREESEQLQRERKEEEAVPVEVGERAREGERISWCDSSLFRVETAITERRTDTAR